MLRQAYVLLLLVCCSLPSPPLFAAEAPDQRALLLVAAEGMLDPRFRQSVVIVTRHGRSNSTVGVIVNRSLDVPLDRVFPGQEKASQHRLHYGGPVAPGQIVFMVRGEVAPEAAITLAERLFLSSDSNSLSRLIDAATPASRLRVFNGFASWAPDQLENEIDRGDWHLLPVDADVLFAEPLDGLWLKLWRRATQLMVRMPPPRLHVALGETDYFRLQAALILGHP